jgi:hypothetical protein
MKFLTSTLIIGSTATLASAGLIAPDSAVAGSVFSSAYNAENTIDGSGLPLGFTPSNPHAVYTGSGGGNHWTTLSGAISNGSAWIEWGFSSAQTLHGMYLWNHRSDGVASNPHYAVKRFDLTFKDALDNTIGSMSNVSATQFLNGAQTYTWAGISGISKVRMDIRQNHQPNGTASFTGIAEVRFENQPVPEPATMSLGFGVACLLMRRWRSR